jgi:mRNA interferase HicA
VKLNDLERHLKSQGCYLERQGGNHTLWKNPATGKVSPVPRHREIKEVIVKSICRQLNIAVPSKQP